MVQLDQEVLVHQMPQGLLEVQENHLVLKVQKVQEVLYLHLPLYLLDPHPVPAHFNNVLSYNYKYIHVVLEVQYSLLHQELQVSLDLHLRQGDH